MMQGKFFLTLLASVCIVSRLDAQVYVSPQIGFKSYGLTGVTTVSSEGRAGQLGIFEAGRTDFQTAVGIGVQSLISVGVYRLDVGADLSLTSVRFMQEGYESRFGTGSYAAHGLSGGLTTHYALDLTPIHRFHPPELPILSPFVGVGIGFNFYSTADVQQVDAASSSEESYRGASQSQTGLLVFYGVDLNLADHLAPFVQFKHLIRFAREFRYTEDPQATIVTNDAPGYFGVAVGIRFRF